MKLRERFDLMEIAKRALLCNRKDAVMHIIKGVKNRFKLDILFAYLNPDFSKLTDYFIIAKEQGKDRIIVFHGISHGECSTTQFDMYASRDALPEFYDNMMHNATGYPTKIFEKMITANGLSLNKKSDKYWMDGGNLETAKTVIKMIEDSIPELSNKKRIMAASH